MLGLDFWSSGFGILNMVTSVITKAIICKKKSFYLRNYDRIDTYPYLRRHVGNQRALSPRLYIKGLASASAKSLHIYIYINSIQSQNIIDSSYYKEIYNKMN